LERLPRELLNCFFLASETVIAHGVCRAVGEGDLLSSHATLLRSLGPISSELSEVTFGFAAAIFRRYIGDELDATVVAKIADAPDISELKLPFFVETKGLARIIAKVAPKPT
jgi:hypothetical protein